MMVSAYVISAICGCFKRESSVNPGIWESKIVPSDPIPWYHIYRYDNIGGYGFGQFTNTSGPGGGGFRCGDYYNWCVANGKSPDDGNAQMDYIVNVERVWYNAPSQRGSYTTIQQFMESTSTNLADLTWDWLASWEGVPGDAYSERYEFAQIAFSYIQQHQNDDPAQYSWISGNFYCSQAQMLNNVMCMYFYFQGYTPSTGNVQGFVDWCISTCNRADVGYGTGELRNQVVRDGITHYDCSSFIWYGLKDGGGFDVVSANNNVDYPFVTTTMPDVLSRLGFIQVPLDGEWKQGDIGLNPDHTEVVYSGSIGKGVCMGAHNGTYPLAEQVSISNFESTASRWTSLWRYGGDTPTPPTPSGKRKKMPFWMMLKPPYLI